MSSGADLRFAFERAAGANPGPQLAPSTLSGSALKAVVTSVVIACALLVIGGIIFGALDGWPKNTST